MTADAFFVQQMQPYSDFLLETQAPLSVPSGARMYHTLTIAELAHPSYKNGEYFTLDSKTAWDWLSPMSGGGYRIFKYVAGTSRMKGLPKLTKAVLESEGWHVRLKVDLKKKAKRSGKR
jgi:hypothetical protein